MREIQYSSGDLVADRRASYAAALAAERAFAEAAELMAQALEMVPQWVAGWNLLGAYREAAGDIAGAVAAWTQLLQLDARGLFGATLKLAAHGAGGSAQAAPAYVEALFDDYASRFEDALVGRLGYRTPEMLEVAIRDTLAARGATRFERALDLGCGTGLMGERLWPLVDRLEGVDLSANMLAEARRKRTYDRLQKADLVAFLLEAPGTADLIVAADVFNYVGDLQGPLAAASNALRPGGLVAFSLETHAGPDAVRLGTTLRFQHATTPTLAICQAVGLRTVRVEATTIRLERGLPVEGAIVLAERV
ncbi:class I SAM-dependent DNA methyltransferase [Devosia sp. A16]|uniref:class I SAM-dependent DNA methyltransferase n=1 Tax=Devosia sp. A16 TaxID=1736675 RepID=UPI0006D7AC01|nr:methyltransferase [Devosia sp. A16]